MNNDEEMLMLMSNIRSHIAVIAIGVWGMGILNILVMVILFLLMNG